MGLSLVELAIGRYPIPSPRQEDIDEIFKHPPDGPPVTLPNATVLPGARSPPAGAGGAAGETKSMAIFELLDYIVNEVNSAFLSLNITRFDQFLDNFVAN